MFAEVMQANTQVFGSRSAPSYFCVLADIRQALTATLASPEPSHVEPLVEACEYQVDTTSPVCEVPEDANHPVLTEEEMEECPEGLREIIEWYTARERAEWRDHDAGEDERDGLHRVDWPWSF